MRRKDYSRYENLGRANCSEGNNAQADGSSSSSSSSDSETEERKSIAESLNKDISSSRDQEVKTKVNTSSDNRTESREEEKEESLESQPKQRQPIDQSSSSEEEKIETNSRHDLSKTKILNDLTSFAMSNSDNDSDDREMKSEVNTSEIKVKVKPNRKMSPESSFNYMHKSCSSDRGNDKTLTTHSVLSSIHKQDQSGMVEMEDFDFLKDSYKKALDVPTNTLKPRDYQEAIVEHI